MRKLARTPGRLAACRVLFSLIVLLTASCQKRPEDHAALPAVELTNGDFESGTQGWAAGDASLAAVDGGVSGKCLALSRLAGPAPYAIQLDRLILQSRTTYRLTFYVKAGSSGEDMFRVGIWDTHALTWAAMTPGKATPQWIKHDITFVASSGNPLSVELIKDSPREGSMLFDSIALKRLGAGDNFATNGDFEDGAVGWNPGNGTFTVTAEGESGKAARVGGKGTAYFIQSNFTQLPVGSPYEFGFSIRSGSGHDEPFSAGVWDGNHMKWVAAQNGVATGSWKHYTVPFTNSIADPVSVEFIKTGAEDGSILVHAVSLVEKARR